MDSTALETLIRHYWQEQSKTKHGYWRIGWNRDAQYSWQPNAAVEAFIAKAGVAVVVAPHKKTPAFERAYQCDRCPPAGTIHMLPRTWFQSPNEYYNGLLHELVHSTGVALERETMPKYQLEEMLMPFLRPTEEATAELGAFMLLQHFDMVTPDVEENNAAYIAGWLHPWREYLPLAEQNAAEAVQYLLQKAA